MSDHIEDLLSAYMDDEVTAEERLQVEAHLSGCEACCAVLQELKEMKKQMVQVFHSIDSPATIEASVMQALQASVPSRSLSRLNWLLAASLSPLLLIAVVVGLLGAYLYKFTAVGFRVVVHLIYAAGSVLGTDPYLISGLALVSLLLIAGSGVSLKLLLKTKAI